MPKPEVKRLLHDFNLNFLLSQLITMVQRLIGAYKKEDHAKFSLKKIK